MNEPRILLGDCLEVLKTFPDNSIDAVVTDPPAGIGMMNKDWDHDKGGRAQWVSWLSERLMECWRVLRPGGHMLVWAIPRNSHWTALAIEDADFEIRDRVSHFFGTGFPKSVNISKQIDRSLGAKPTVVGKNPNHRPVSGVGYEGIYAGGNTGAAHLTRPTSPEAKKWEGFGSSLKPFCEDWWLARKPFKGPLYKNVLKHGTGALNIDACRIPTNDKLTRKLGKTTKSDSGWKSVKRSEIAGKDGGRWPAHVVIDKEAAAVLDDQSGVLASGERKAETPNGPIGYHGGGSQTANGTHYRPDAGGASRFLYQAKPSKKEKNAGLKGKNPHPTVKSVELMKWLVRLITPPGGAVLDLFCGSGSTGVACVQEGFDFIGIDSEPEYVKIAEQRIRHAMAAGGPGTDSTPSSP